MTSYFKNETWHERVSGVKRRLRAALEQHPHTTWFDLKCTVSSQRRGAHAETTPPRDTTLHSGTRPCDEAVLGGGVENGPHNRRCCRLLDLVCKCAGDLGINHLGSDLQAKTR